MQSSRKRYGALAALDLPEDSNPDESLFIIADDHERLEQRVVRLLKKTAHAEYPRSRTRHLVSNVQVREQSEDALCASSTFATYRSKNGITDTFIGTSKYELRLEGATLKIAKKTVILAMDALRPHGRVSIIL